MSRAPRAAADSGTFEARFFLLRSAMLPIAALTAWSDGLAAATAAPERLDEAIRADLAKLRERLAAWLARPEIREALFIASPSLHRALDHWRRDPESRKGQRCERTLVRYLTRMAARPTPFGLFAGNTVGEIGETTRIELAPPSAHRRHSRPDLDFIFNLAEELGRQDALRRELVYRPNSSLYAVGGSWHLVETRFSDARRTYHLVEIEASDYLDEILSRAAGGAVPAELADALVELLGADEVSREEALDFVDELIASQVLVGDLTPPLTGPEPCDALIDRLRELPAAAPVAARLAEARAALAAIDARGLGVAPAAYRDVRRPLDELPARPDPLRFCQVDLFKTAVDATLGEEVLAEARRGAELLHRLGRGALGDGLGRFREAFVRRYGEGRLVPLTEAVGDETGVGFQGAAPGAEASPLLSPLRFTPPSGAAKTPWDRGDEHLLRRLDEAWREGAVAIELDGRDLELLTPDEEPPPLPDAFHVMGVLAAASQQALEQGDFRFRFIHASGPAGARLLGRFCHGDARLRRAVEEHLRAEEALHVDAVYAEIVHLPQGRMGNVLARPVLRGYEIPFLGRSGAPPERQIPVTDLLVTVRGDRVLLVSERLGRQVVPRLTSAHNYEELGLDLYRLLGFLQNQGVSAGVYWSWRALEGAAFLPAVRSGRLLLARARWRVPDEELEPLRQARGGRRFEAVQRWRAARRLPRWAVLDEKGEELMIDFENVLAVDGFLDGTRGMAPVMLYEPFPAPEELVVRGPEGSFVSEIAIPMVRTRRPAAVEREPPPAPSAAAAVRRSFLPGSEWLYAKLYVGPSAADQVLRQVVASVTRAASAVLRAWFFIRYADPDWHLRVRFHGEPRALMELVLPRLLESAAPLRDDGRLYRLEIGTYDREVERYGGPRGVVVAERLFQADSEAVLRILEAFGDDAPDARWRLALLGVDRLLDDAGFTVAEKSELVAAMRGGAMEQLGEGKPLRLQLDRDFRARRQELEALFDQARLPSDLEAGRAALAERSRRSAPSWAELRRLESAEELTSPLAAIVPSLVHMNVNRLIHASAQAHEIVLYDYLARLYESALARSRERP
jgi:thiopeptide-type bacteriocin biosynthesis protein